MPEQTKKCKKIIKKVFRKIFDNFGDIISENGKLTTFVIRPF